MDDILAPAQDAVRRSSGFSSDEQCAVGQELDSRLFDVMRDGLRGRLCCPAYVLLPSVLYHLMRVGV